MTELLPCPFCGGEAIVYGGWGHYYVRCEECGITNERLTLEFDGIDDYRGFTSSEDAAEHWNTRYERTCKFIDGRDDRGPKAPKCSVCGYQPILPQWTVEGEPKTGVYIERYCPLCGSKEIDDA